MKRSLFLLSPIVFAACSGATTVHLAMNSNDAAPASASVGTSTAALVASADAGTSGNDDLTNVKSVVVTVTEVDAHFSKDDGKDTESAADVQDGDNGWQVVTKTAQTVDLAALKGTNTQLLGAVNTSQAKVTQVRLKLKSDGAAGNGDDIIAKAVTALDGTVCDLIIPHSAVDPGVKIEGNFHSPKFASGDETVEVNLRLADSRRETQATGCAYRLNPHMEIEGVEVGDTHRESADGGH